MSKQKSPDSPGVRLGLARWLRGPDQNGKADKTLARDLGLEAGKAPLRATLEELTPDASTTPPAADTIAKAFQMQLDLLRQSLGLTTAALLWADAEGRQLHLRGIATVRSDIAPGPFPAGSGITGALTGEQEEVAVAPVKEHFAALPYYRGSRGVGSLCALRLPAADGGPLAILCVDRTSASPWRESERLALRLATRRLALDVEMARQMQAIDSERQMMRRVCIGLRELNNALGLSSAFAATTRAVKALVAADFVGISLVEGDGHRTVHADGRHAERLLGVEFPLDQGLVAQALKFNTILPENGAYRGHCPVFSQHHLFTDCPSLFIVPLRKEEGNPIGVLTVASRTPKIFNRGSREMLELIATQVATKIDLARSHDQINHLATTDSLTGLANQRAFRHGLELMLHRARRQEIPLSLVLCDVDHFKAINDSYGHPFGDKVLKEVATALGDTIRVVDLAARYGGEEFALILEGSDLASAHQVAERLRQRVAGITLPHGGQQVGVTISLGLAAYPRHGNDIPTLIERADQALYQAKQSGRNRTVCWTGPNARTG